MTVDGELAFVGGIDITDFGGDRFDTSGAPGPPPAGLARRWRPAPGSRGGRRRRAFRDALARAPGEELPPAHADTAAGEHTVQVVRTVCEGM